MSGYSSTTSIIFVAFGILYGAGFLFAAWILVRKLLERQEKVDQNVVEGAPNTTGLIATPVVVGATAPPKPSNKKESPSREASEPSSPIDLGIDSPIDGGGL